MLQEVRWTGMPFDPRSLEAGCLQFSERFSSYIPYCWEQENTLEFAKRQIDTNPHFVVYLKWVETHPQCNRMRLGDMQAKPHQRITKYPLLLKAVLKNTPDPDLQQTIRDMLSSVNGFLETINDYLRCMDEEHALSISAQRLEGYEVPGINEEIDKHIREFCHFDLTLPMVGVGPTFVRKLLLEENLKMRGGKDSKEEVVALLFSDVLLISKVQKKVERLKVARPPLALDRTCCVPLKDGFSFLLVEVSELGCAMNVYIFVTATAVSCSKWVSTIHQAKAALKTLKEVETSRQLDSQRIQPSDTKPIEKPLDNKTPEWIEKQVKQRADEEVEVVFLGSEERRVTWNHNKTSAADNLRSKPKDGKNLFIGKYPEVDYPTVEPVAPQKDHLLSNSPNSIEEVPSSTVGGTTRPMKTGYNIQLEDHNVWTDPGKSLSTDVAFLEVGRFSRKLKSPKLRRRRPYSSQHVDAYQTHGTVFGESEMVWTTPPTNSSSNSDSDSSQKLQGHFDQRHTNNDTSHRVLKLGFLKTHPALFLNMYENRVSPEPETFSEPELPQELPEKRKSVKAQRSASIPDIHELHAISTSPVLRTYMGEQSPRFNHHPHAHVSPVEGLLERAKVRVRREGGQTGRNENVQDTRTWIPPPSPPLFSESLCPSPSDGDREVELMRHRVPTVSQGWREQLVDGDAEDKKYSHIFVNELSVDWPALCFDDDQDIDHLEPIDVSNEGTGILEDIQRTLTTGVQESKISQV
uniref:Pleckstrin homology domain containing, family G (with RhoGef domain) member 6 n=2 Tax=Gadus morhua TaxID=8049 RepID=A0A8C5AJ58_GADMO